MPGPRVAAAWVAAAFALAALGCGGASQEPPGDRADASSSQRRLNVVLVVVDTLRADHLSAYGYHHSTSPNLDAFAAEAVLFETNRSQATCTIPSTNSLLTSRYAAHFVGQPGGFKGIPEGMESIAEILAARGYATLAISASPMIRKTPTELNPGAGFGRGFDRFDESCEWRDASCLNTRLGHHLKDLPRPFFAYLHYMEPHADYQPPPSHRFRFVRPYEGHDFIARGHPEPIAAMIYGDGPELELSDRDMEHMVDLYDEEIAYFDDRFPVLLERLREAGGMEDTVIALAADHGEEFLDHGHVKHCRTPYDTVVRTPLILRIPGGPAGLRIAAPVMNLDLVPTLLDYVGEDPGRHGMEGRSLRPLMEGETPVGRQLAFSSQALWRSVADERYKLLHLLGTRRFHLYDLVADPGEQQSLRWQRAQTFRRLRRELFEWVERVEGEVASRESLEAAREEQRRLKALGYIQ